MSAFIIPFPTVPQVNAEPQKPGPTGELFDADLADRNSDDRGDRGPYIDCYGREFPGPPDSISAQHEWQHDRLVDSMRQLLNAGVRPPRFHEAVREDCPKATLEEFNAAADQVWSELTEEERADFAS